MQLRQLPSALGTAALAFLMAALPSCGPEKKYDWKINQAALDKAVTAAQPIRAKADSARSAQTPPSAVPVPGATPPAPPPVDTSAKK